MKFLIEDKQHVYWNPYFGGFLLGLIVILTFYITGRGIGASGGVKSTVVATVNAIAPNHAQENAYFSKFIKADKSPMNTWLVFQMLGLIAGAFFSGAINHRLKFRIQHSPKISTKTRIWFALLGGALFGAGAQLARGCTSGGALSGFAVNSLAGLILMLSIFGSGFMFAYFFRKLWI